jgi:hypothetical protein
MAWDRFLTLVCRWHNVGILLALRALWCHSTQSKCGSKMLSTRQWSRKMRGMRIWAYKLHICILPVYFLSRASIISYSSSIQKSIHNRIANHKALEFRDGKKMLESLVYGGLLCIHHSYEICVFCIFQSSSFKLCSEHSLDDYKSMEHMKIHKQ